MKVSIISFSQTGYRLSEMIYWVLKERDYEVKSYTKSKYTKKLLDESMLDEDSQDFRNVKEFSRPVDESIHEWTGRRFQDSDAIVFIGSSGIAVRSIAPFVKNKKIDPAVVVVDEQGTFAISLLSGHVGGANELAEEIAEIIHAQPVITTANAVNDKFAVDVFARKNGCFISDMEMAKELSAALLKGTTVGFMSDFPWIGEIPAELKLCEEGEEKPEFGIYVTAGYMEHPFMHTLYLIPRVITTGVFCEKDTSKETVEKVIRRACDELLAPSIAMERVVSIDFMKDESGIKEYCCERNLPFDTYTEEELDEVNGTFAESETEGEAVGAPNICEKAALLGSSRDGKGRLILRKYEQDKVAVALAMKKWSVEFDSSAED